MESLCGFINIYKEKGYTSHDIVNIVRKNLNRIKTGHTGTLDPEATGVLPICIGKATKLSEYISSNIKEYIAEITLGIKTTTYDHTGEIVAKGEINSTKEQIENCIYSFKGNISQVPPMYSAIKVNGKKLYKLAREGKEIQRKSRDITVYEMEILEFISLEKIKIKILCSKGTYIRSICNDIGDKLGCYGHMSNLIRTRSSDFYIEDSITLDEFKNKVSSGNILDILKPVEYILSGYKKVTVFECSNKYLYNGNKVSKDYTSYKNIFKNEKVLVYDYKNILIGVYEEEDGFLKPLTVFL